MTRGELTTLAIVASGVAVLLLLTRSRSSVIPTNEPLRLPPDDARAVYDWLDLPSDVTVD